jgi:glycosyltransferase involved in cell wall biosynthesis
MHPVPIPAAELPPTRPLKIAISINACWNFINFRAGLVRALVRAGHQVIAIAPSDPLSSRLEALGCRFVPLAMDSKSTSPLNDLKLTADYRRILRRERPDVYLGYTIKPNVYGSLAAHSLGIPVINNISGLGTAFIRQGWLNRIVRWLYRTALSRSRIVFFQNRDDRDLFTGLKLVDPARTRLLPGSGIDLADFRPEASEQDGARTPVFLMIARLLTDKGVNEYVEAARLVRADVPDARFRLLGFLGVQNRTAISAAQVASWQAEGVIDYLGDAEDVRPHIAAADCIVLPSYREGLPRTLLEGAAMGKPLIATDVPGCRDMVDEGENGFLCTVRDAGSLADAMRRMIALAPAERARMGHASRAKVEATYDERIVIGHYLTAIGDAVPQPNGARR